MKIITKNKAFVQLEDIVHIVNAAPSYASLPTGIKYSYVSDFIKSSNSKTKFIEFTEKDEIEYFKNCDYILDYNYIKDMSLEDIKQYKMLAINQKDQIVNQINLLEETEIEAREQLVAKCELLVYKMYSIMKYEQFKEANKDLNLPVEIVEAEQRDIKRLFKKIFKNKKTNF